MYRTFRSPKRAAVGMKNVRLISCLLDNISALGTASQVSCPHISPPLLFENTVCIATGLIAESPLLPFAMRGGHAHR